jgi:hypothetical protein
MEELVIRYALPGFPLILVYYLSQKSLSQSTSPVLDIAFLLAAAVLLGNIIQNIWMLLFELPFFGLAYHSKHRAALKKLNEISSVQNRNG